MDKYLMELLPFADVDGDDVHGVFGALGEVAETGD